MRLDQALPKLDNVRACAGGYVALCPAHDDRNASLSIRGTEEGRAMFHCFAGCSYAAIINALGGGPHPIGLPTSDARPAFDDAKRTEIALRIWHQSRPAPGTLAETYLRRRGITIPVPATLRFHRALKHPSGPILLPAMVAAVSNLDRSVRAIHRTFFDSEGDKTRFKPPKAALGPIAGRAVHLAPAGEMLALAEGIETALSVQQAVGIPAWATLGTSNLARVELPECVRELIICADADPAGERAAREAAARFMREGRRVRIARPMRGDFNDALQG
jgi:putative DNA primase/helicase